VHLATFSSSTLTFTRGASPDQGATTVATNNHIFESNNGSKHPAPHLWEH